MEVPCVSPGWSEMCCKACIGCTGIWEVSQTVEAAASHCNRIRAVPPFWPSQLMWVRRRWGKAGKKTRGGVPGQREGRQRIVLDVDRWRVGGAAGQCTGSQLLSLSSMEQLLATSTLALCCLQRQRRTW